MKNQQITGSASVTMFNLFVINAIEIGHEIRRWNSDGSCPRIATRKTLKNAKKYCVDRIRWELQERPFWFSEDDRQRLLSELEAQKPKPRIDIVKSPTKNKEFILMVDGEPQEFGRLSDLQRSKDNRLELAEFISFSDRYGTSPELMRAIFIAAMHDTSKALQILAGPPSRADLSVIVSIVTDNFNRSTTEFEWGVLGNKWASMFDAHHDRADADHKLRMAEAGENA